MGLRMAHGGRRMAESAAYVVPVVGRLCEALWPLGRMPWNLAFVAFSTPWPCRDDAGATPADLGESPPQHEARRPQTTVTWCRVSVPVVDGEARSLIATEPSRVQGPCPPRGTAHTLQRQDMFMVPDFTTDVPFPGTSIALRNEHATVLPEPLHPWRLFSCVASVESRLCQASAFRCRSPSRTWRSVMRAGARSWHCHPTAGGSTSIGHTSAAFLMSIEDRLTVPGSAK